MTVSAKNIMTGTLFLFVCFTIFIGMFSNIGELYGRASPEEFNKTFGSYEAIEGLIAESSTTIQQDTFNPLETFVAITGGILKMILLFFSLPVILYVLLYELQVFIGIPSIVSNFIVASVYITIISISIYLIAKAKAES